MSRPSFAEGVLIALGAALAASILATAFALILPPAAAIEGMCVGLGFGYLLYLLGRSPERAGRLVMVVLWILITALVWSLIPGLWAQILAQLGMLWLVRSLAYHATPLAVLLDLGLVLSGLAAATWALERTGSIFLSVWCLLLVQALFSAIPAHPERASGEREARDPFDCAERAAERALRRLSLND